MVHYVKHPGKNVYKHIIKSVWGRHLLCLHSVPWMEGDEIIFINLDESIRWVDDTYVPHYCERRRDDSLMLATIHDNTRNVLNVQHIIPNSKRWDYSDIPGGGKIYIKGPSHMDDTYVPYAHTCIHTLSTNIWIQHTIKHIIFKYSLKRHLSSLTEDVCLVFWKSDEEICPTRSEFGHPYMTTNTQISLVLIILKM